MLIFEKEDISKIIDFTLKNFFRHYSLYEFSFKPRRELVLKCEPYLNTKFNAELRELEEMQPVDGEEAEKIKSYLSLFQNDQGRGSSHKDMLSSMSPGENNNDIDQGLSP